MKQRFLERIFVFFLVLSVTACSNARYAMGPASADIEAIPGYEGTVRAVYYKSSEPDLDHRRMTVYLPKGYNDNPAKRYPVMYVLHGARGNEVTWIERGECLITLDSLRAAGAARDFILVLTNENNYFGEKDYKDGHAVNAVRAFWTVDGETESFFIKDIVATVDSMFRTVPRKEARAIAGMSTGALQALYISSNNPDEFDYIGLFSPYAYDLCAQLRYPSFYTALGRKMRRQFEEAPAYFGIMIGKTDFFYPHMLLFDRSLTNRGFKHEFVVTSGGHEWYNWRKYLIHFYERSFK